MQALVLHSLLEVHSVILVPDELATNLFETQTACELAEYYNQSIKVVDVTECKSLADVLVTIREDNGEDVITYDEFVEFTGLAASEETLTPKAYQDFLEQLDSLDLSEWWAANQGKFI
jgi:hypothetical protein